MVRNRLSNPAEVRAGNPGGSRIAATRTDAARKGSRLTSSTDNTDRNAKRGCGGGLESRSANGRLDGPGEGMRDSGYEGLGEGARACTASIPRRKGLATLGEGPLPPRRRRPRPASGRMRNVRPQRGTRTPERGRAMQSQGLRTTECMRRGATRPGGMSIYAR